MLDFLKDAGAFVALVSGLVALAKGLLELGKEFQANKSVVSALIGHRRFWIATGVTLLGTAVLIGTVFRYAGQRKPPITSPSVTSSHPTSTVATASADNSTSIPRFRTTTTVQIWKVESDEKGRILSSKEFPVQGESAQPVDQIGRWLTREIGQLYDLNSSEVHVHVQIPSERSSGKLEIKLEPLGPYEVYLSAVESNHKSRIPLTDFSLADLPPSFFLEVTRTGYDTAKLQVPAQQSVDKTFVLTPQPIAIGIEAFTGDHNSLATQLTNYLVHNRRFAIKNADALKALRKKIADEKDVFAKDPRIQTGARTALGLDLIIAGTYENSPQ